MTINGLWLVKNPCFSRVWDIKKRFLLFFATFPLYHKANQEAKAVYYTTIKHSGHLRTLEKMYISLVFSNACRVLSQCNTVLTFLYLLNEGDFEKNPSEVLRSCFVGVAFNFFLTPKHKEAVNF